MTTPTNNTNQPVLAYAVALDSDNERLPHEHTVPSPKINDGDRGGTAMAKEKRCTWWVLGILLGAVICFIAFIIASKGSKSKTQETPEPVTIENKCQDRRLRITEICDVPDLDDDIFGRDTTMDIKVLLNDEVHWPQDLRADCSATYGTYEGACVIPDSSLMGCFPLKNSVPIDFVKDGLTPSDLKITIYDEDGFTSDEFIDIHVPKDEWYFPGPCNETTELEFQSSTRSARVKLIVDPTFDDELACGVDAETLAAALNATAHEMEAMGEVLRKYVTLDSVGGSRRNHRNLFIGALISGARFLVSGVSSFGRLFARGARSQGPLSTLADFTTIGSTWFASNGPSGNSFDPKRQEELFEQVFERFDQIDTQLDDIQSQLNDGFAAIELVIQEEFASQELDDWINVHLGVLNDDYRAYLDPSHTIETRVVYENIFRNSCRVDHSPFTTFKVLYSHACNDCQLLDGQRSQQFIMDTFVDLAKANFDDLTARVLWFRQSFGVVIVAALTEAIYLHSVCLYQPEAICQNVDPVWSSRLNEMGLALDEVAESLVASEERLQT